MQFSEGTMSPDNAAGRWIGLSSFRAYFRKMAADYRHVG
jgi:hypothetical protein